MTENLRLLESQNSIWSEEDWADHFSALTMNELKRSGALDVSGDKNMACALVDSTSHTYSNNSVTPMKNDSHSAGLLRVIMTGIDQGNLAPACKAFVEYAQESGRSLSCE